MPTSPVELPPDLLPRLRDVRRDLHRHPELAFAEHRTQEVVERWLAERGYRTRRCAGTGVVADTRPGAPGRTVAVRVDLDALPMPETTDLPYRSVHEGVAHKCGHDGHTAIGLGLAEVLAREGDAVPGNVRLVFQPAEEGGVHGGGAIHMVRQDVLEGVDEIYALHNWPGFPRGTVRVAPGPVMAEVTNVRIVVRGRGGHASQPQHARDGVLAAAHVVTALQSVVARNVGPLERAVVSLCTLHGGTANNVIPEEVVMTGTVRSFEEEVRDRVHRRMREVVESTARAFGTDGRIDFEPEYPVLVNDPGCARAVVDAAGAVLGERAVGAGGLPLTASEDFAWFARERPGAYFFLGAGDPVEETPPCHHPDFDFDDGLLESGVRILHALCAARSGRG